jgi:glucosamine-6-phosphate deaminase
MEVIIQPNQEAAAALVGRIVARELRANPHLVLGLATGQTMECVYRHLVRVHQAEKLDFSLCRTFNLDEYVGLFPSDPNSYRYYMQVSVLTFDTFRQRVAVNATAAWGPVATAFIFLSRFAFPPVSGRPPWALRTARWIR